MEDAAASSPSTPARPAGVTVVCGLVLAWSSFVAILSLLSLSRGSALDASWGLLEAVAKIALAAAMLKRNDAARRVFITFWFVAALVIDPIVFRRELADAGFLVRTVFVVLFGIVYAVILSERSARLWFGASESELIAKLREKWAARMRESPPIARLGKVLVVVSSCLLLFFAWHVWLDLTTLTWKKGEAVIVEAEVKGNVVRKVSSSNSEMNSSGTRATTTEIVSYDPEITYRYWVEGTEYTSSQFATFRSTLSAIFKPDAVRERYVPESRQEIWYDPKHPEKAVLQRGISPYYVFAFFVLIMFGIGRSMGREGGRKLKIEN